MLAGGCVDQGGVERRPHHCPPASRSTGRRSHCVHRMKRRGLQLSRRHRWSLYSVGLTLFISGVIWIVLHRLDEAGKMSGPWRELKPSVMAVHGLFAAGFVLLLGTLLPVHVRHS